MLNLTRASSGTSHYGITRLEDLAKLKYVPDINLQKPYNFREIPARDPEKVQELSTDLVIGPNLDRMVQRAQFMLNGLHPSNPYVNKTKNTPWLTGTGYGTLPETVLSMRRHSYHV
jgi:hypothetical protein